jgi:hypothetical protein
MLEYTQAIMTAFALLVTCTILNIILFLLLTYYFFRINKLIDYANRLADETCEVVVIGDYKTDPYGDL